MTWSEIALTRVNLGEFHVPEVGKLFHEVTYPELDEKNARKTVRDYQSDGARAKRTGRDEFYPKKKRDDHHGRRDRYSGGRIDFICDDYTTILKQKKFTW